MPPGTAFGLRSGHSPDTVHPVMRRDNALPDQGRDAPRSAPPFERFLAGRTDRADSQVARPCRHLKLTTHLENVKLKSCTCSQNMTSSRAHALCAWPCACGRAIRSVPNRFGGGPGYLPGGWVSRPSTGAARAGCERGSSIGRAALRASVGRAIRACEQRDSRWECARRFGACEQCEGRGFARFIGRRIG